MKKTKLTALIGDKEYPVYVSENESLYALVDGVYKSAFATADRIIQEIPKERKTK